MTLLGIVLEALAPYAVVVGSYARDEQTDASDVDLVVSREGFTLFKHLCERYAMRWESCVRGQAKTWDVEVPVEVFVDWYGPGYEALRSRTVPVTVHGVRLRAWPEETR